MRPFLSAMFHDFIISRNLNVSVIINLLEIKRSLHPLYQSCLEVNFILLIRRKIETTCRLITWRADILKFKRHFYFRCSKEFSRISCLSFATKLMLV